jgi:hypothetical protein
MLEQALSARNCNKFEKGLQLDVTIRTRYWP